MDLFPSKVTLTYTEQTNQKERKVSQQNYNLKIEHLLVCGIFKVSRVIFPIFYQVKNIVVVVVVIIQSIGVRAGGGGAFVSPSPS